MTMNRFSINLQLDAKYSIRFFKVIAVNKVN